MSMYKADMIVKRNIRKTIKGLLERSITDDFQVFNKYKLPMNVEFDSEYVGILNRFCANSWYKIKVLKALITVNVLAFEKVGVTTYCVVIPTDYKCNYFDEHCIKVRSYASKIIKICRDWSKNTCKSKLTASITYDSEKAKVQNDDLYTLDIKLTGVYESRSHRHNVDFSDIGMDKADAHLVPYIRNYLRNKTFSFYLRPSSSNDSGWWVHHSQIIQDLVFDNSTNIEVVCSSNYNILVSDRMKRLKSFVDNSGTLEV